jgi:hypothetical protein
MKKLFSGFFAIFLFLVAVLANWEAPAGEKAAKPIALFRMVELPEKLSVGYAVVCVDVNGDGKSPA